VTGTELYTNREPQRTQKTNTVHPVGITEYLPV
jgi:hypothetical protein